MLGVLKAGKFYLALDASQPRARTAAILAECRPALLVADGERMEEARALVHALGLAGMPLLCLDTLEPGLSTENPGFPFPVRTWPTWSTPRAPPESPRE